VPQQQQEATRHHIQQHTRSVGDTATTTTTGNSSTVTDSSSSSSATTRGDGERAATVSNITSRSVSDAGRTLPSITGDGSRTRRPQQLAGSDVHVHDVAEKCSDRCDHAANVEDLPPPLRRRKSSGNGNSITHDVASTWMQKQKEKDDALKLMMECSICLDVMIDPVTLACGHNFCKSCLQALILHSSEEAFNCPIDRYRFPRSYPLRTSITLQAILEMVDLQSLDV
jgi:hypothetical protein